MRSMGGCRQTKVRFMTRKLSNLLDKPAFLILGVIVVNLFVIIACPNLVVPPQLSTQRGTILINLIVCSVPLLWTLFLVIWGRNRNALTVALINLVPAIVWLAYAIPLAVRAFHLPVWGPSFWLHFFK